MAKVSELRNFRSRRLLRRLLKIKFLYFETAKYLYEVFARESEKDIKENF